MDRRRFLHSAAGAVATTALAQQAVASTKAGAGTITTTPNGRPLSDALSQHSLFVLPALGDGPNAVKRAVDAATMSIHRDKHHATYVSNLSTALASQTALQAKTLRELLTTSPSLPNTVRNAFRNNGGAVAARSLTA